MKIKFLSELALNTVNVNLSKYVRFFADDTNERLLSELQKEISEPALKESNYTFPDNLELDGTLRGGPEVANVVKFHGAMRKLPHSIACDCRIWAGLTIGHFWQFTKNRWDFDKGITAPKVRDHFLFMGQSKKAYTRNALSRLWWVGDLTYDEKRGNPYEITAFTMKDTDYVVNLLERNFSSNRVIFREFVEAVEQGRKEGMDIGRPEVRELCKYLNLLGGVYVLDALPPGMIRDKIYSKAQKLTQKK